MTKKHLKQEIIRVTKTFTFDMAHALLCYDGPCRNIHGHTYTLSVTLRGKPITDKEHPKNGMVIDFAYLKKLVNDLIISHYDHALVLNEEIDTNVVNAISSQFDKILLVKFQPTAENLVLEFKRLLVNEFNTDEMELIHLKLQETPTSYAEWYLSDNIR